MALDLHTHSTCSDGSDTPAELVARAAAAGLSAIALTDHDNLDGIDAAIAAAAAHDLTVISGAELSVDWGDETMHLLVYYLRPVPGPLQDRLRAIRSARHERNLKVIAALQRLGCDITYEEVAAEAGGGVVGRPHVAEVLRRKGIVESIQQAFDLYLARGRPAYQERLRLGYREAAELARASGGVPVMAHPHTIGVSAGEYETAFRDAAGAGFLGIEAYYSEYTPDVREHLATVARSLGLIATGGSDYHGSYKPGLELGVGRGDLKVPERVIDDLEAARERV